MWRCVLSEGHTAALPPARPASTKVRSEEMPSDPRDPRASYLAALHKRATILEPATFSLRKHHEAND
jgi:hypothetical protein